MKIKLQELSEEERRYSGEVGIDVLALDSDPVFRPKSPITYDIGVCIISEMMIARGSLSAEFNLQCSRCGEEYDALVEENDYSLALDLQSHSPKKGGPDADKPEIEDLPEENDRDSVLYYVEKGIEFVDLTPDMRESIILRFPGYPICRETCKGRCPKCGQNLNTDVCICEPEPTDDRWGMLDQIEVK